MPKRDIPGFIAHWSAASPSERANSQAFLLELCDLLEVPAPDNHPNAGYFFEYPVTEQHADGTTSQGRIDLYKRACFVLESKQFQEDPFPFPLCGEAEKERIRKLAEELDAHRKRVQAQHGLTLTGLYNVLEKLRAAGVRPSSAAATSEPTPALESSRAPRPSRAAAP